MESQESIGFIKATKVLMKKNSADIMKIREFFQKYGYNQCAKKNSGVNNLHFRTWFSRLFLAWLWFVVLALPFMWPSFDHLFNNQCAGCSADQWCSIQFLLSFPKCWTRTNTMLDARTVQDTSVLLQDTWFLVSSASKWETDLQACFIFLILKFLFCRMRLFLPI